MILHFYKNVWQGAELHYLEFVKNVSIKENIMQVSIWETAKIELIFLAGYKICLNYIIWDTFIRFTF